MSFKSLQISYTPPLTVPAPLRALVTTAPTEATLQASVQSQTVAGQVSSGLDGLIATSAYLQQVILAKCAGSGVQFTAAENPDLAAALGRLYQTATPPLGISVEMYANMIDAELALMQMDIALGNDAASQPSPYTQADLTTATKAFETAMAGSLGFQNNMALKLRALKGDQTICQNWQEGLAGYPAYRGTSSTLPSGLDMSAGTSALFTNFIAGQSSNYASTFSMLTTPGSVESDIVPVATALLGEAPAVLSAYVNAFSVLLSGSHGQMAQDLASDMTNFMFVRLLSEVGCMAMLLDQTANLGISMIKNDLGAVSGLLQQVQALGDQVGHIATGPLKGMVQGGPCSKQSTNKGASPAKTQTQNAWDQTFGSASKGIRSLATHLDQAMRWINDKNQQMHDALRKLMNRRLGDSSDFLQLMCSIQALETIIALTTGIILQITNSPTPITAQQPLQIIGSVLSTLSSPSGSSYSMQSGAVVVTPPTVPPVPPQVQLTLNAGGAGLVSSQNLSTVPIGASSAIPTS